MNVSRRSLLLAAAGVFGTGTGWPDVIVASIMGSLGIWGGWQIIRHSLSDLHGEPALTLDERGRYARQ